MKSWEVYPNPHDQNHGAELLTRGGFQEGKGFLVNGRGGGEGGELHAGLANFPTATPLTRLREGEIEGGDTYKSCSQGSANTPKHLRVK